MKYYLLLILLIMGASITITSYALPLPLLGQCEYFGAYHEGESQPYGEWYFQGDKPVKWCDRDA